MPDSRLLTFLCLALCLALPVHAASTSEATGVPANVCASVATCDAEIDRFQAAHDSELLAMALWGKIAALQRAGKPDEAKRVREYLIAVLPQAFGPEHAYAQAARSATPEAGMQALLPVWQQRQQRNAGLAARRGPTLERLRAGKNMVKVAEDYFEIGKYEVTQAEWDAVMGTDPSHFKGCPDCPVENIDGDSIRAFLAKLNQLTGRQYRLPTDKEWWRVLEAGFSGSADENAWHDGNAGGRTHPVGQKKPNALGVYDLQGNVSEWVEEIDSHKRPGDGYLKALGVAWDGMVPEGFWNWTQKNAPRYPTLGFRLARSLESPPGAKKALPAACQVLPDAPKPVSPSAASPASLPKGFRDCPNCPEMVLIPTGRFEMGAEDYFEKPRHGVDIKGFALARTELTVGEFRRFVARLPNG